MRLSISSKPVPVYFLDRGQPRLYSSPPVTSSALSPPARCQLEYLNEGAANIIFRILPPAGSSNLPPRLRRKLLRIRKNVPHVPTADETMAALSQNFSPLFPETNIVSHELIALDAGVPALLNETLAKLVRPRHRAGDFLPNEELRALLVTDMTANADVGGGSGIPGDAVLVQLKPKWLTQSPNAPPDATRCRTCAIRAHRLSLSSPTASDLQDACPLDLVHSVPEERRRAFAAVTPDRRIREYLADPAAGQTLFQQLRANQMMLDSEGILKTAGTQAIFSLCKAMTLRDCTLFVRRCGDEVEARLGDLDLKQPQKLARWKQVEAMLISDGWYTNTEPEAVWQPERICVLSR